MRMYKTTLAEGVLTINPDQAGETEKLDFRGRTDIRVVKLNGVTALPAGCFLKCTNLTQADLGDQLTYLGNYAFRDTALTEIELPGSVVELGDGVFGGCAQLRSFQTAPASRFVGVGAMLYQKLPLEAGMNLIAASGATGKVVLEEGVRKIGPLAFSNSGITSAELPDTCTCIEWGAFAGSEKLERIRLSDSTEYAGNGCFGYCPALRYLTLYPGQAGPKFLEKYAGSIRHLGAYWAILADPGRSPADVRGKEEQWAMVEGFFAMKTRGEQLTAEQINSYKTFLLGPGRALWEHLVETGGEEVLQFLLDERAVSFDEAENLLEAAERCKNVPVKAALLNYRIPRPNTIEHVLEAFKPPRETAAEWNGELQGDGARLTGLCQPERARTIAIPNTWKGKPVRWLSEELFRNCETLEELILPDELAEIPKALCKGLKKLKRVAVSGERLTAIGDEAFAGCRQLRQFHIPKGVKRIGERAFQGTSLDEVLLPDSVTDIGEAAFLSCGRLKRVSFPQDMAYVPEGCFAYCINLEAARFGTGLKEIREQAFIMCDFSMGLFFPENLRTIGEGAFSCCKMRELTLPDGLQYMGKRAFMNCRALNSVVLPAGLSVLEEGTFSNCESMRVIQLPNGLKKIEKNALSGRSQICCLDLPETLCSLGENSLPDGDLHEKTGTPYALSALHMPAALTDVAPGVLSKLNRITVDQGNLIFRRSEDFLLKGDHLVRYMGTKDTCKVPMGIRVIEQGAFSGHRELKRLALPDSVQVIGAWAFEECEGLAEIQLGDTIAEIGERAFRCCGIRSITIPKGLKTLNSYLFADCKQLETVHLPTTIRSIRHSAFLDCSKLKQICIPDGTMEIDNSAFFRCAALQQVELPESLVAIHARAFWGCKALTEVRIPNQTMRLGDDVFLCCERLNQLWLPKNIHLPKNDLTENTVMICAESGGEAERYALRNGLRYQDNTLPDD